MKNGTRRQLWSRWTRITSTPLNIQDLQSDQSSRTAALSPAGRARNSSSSLTMCLIQQCTISPIFLQSASTNIATMSLNLATNYGATLSRTRALVHEAREHLTNMSRYSHHMLTTKVTNSTGLLLALVYYWQHTKKPSKVINSSKDQMLFKAPSYLEFSHISTAIYIANKLVNVVLCLIAKPQIVRFKYKSDFLKFIKCNP